jgi:hypothetical protein
MSSKGMAACGNCKNKFTQSFTGSTSNKYYCRIKPSTKTKLGMELVKITQAKCVSYIYDPDGMKINQSNMSGKSPWKTGNFPEYSIEKAKRKDMFTHCANVNCGEKLEKMSENMYCNIKCKYEDLEVGEFYKQDPHHGLFENEK